MIDSRHGHHEALEDFFAGLMGVMGSLGSGLANERIVHTLAGRGLAG